jgi:hypothetical protein
VIVLDEMETPERPLCGQPGTRKLTHQSLKFVLTGAS